MNKKEIIDNINDIYLDYRRMSTDQMKKKYGGSINTIKYALKDNNFIVDKKIINADLSNEELIFMYDSLLNGDIKSLSNGMFICKNKLKYAIIIFKYLINDVLKWGKEDIINNYSSSILDKFLLKGILLAIESNTYGILNLSFPEYNIKSWELKFSSVGNGFWSIDTNILEVLAWLKDKLLNDKKFENINQCAKFGFDNIIDEYKLTGMRSQVFNSTIELFEKMYNCKYNKEEMLKDNYTFKIKPMLDIEIKLNNNIYLIQKEYYELDDVKKTLCNEIIRFCENENKYPEMHDMSNKNGYISQSQFTKYMNGFTNIYKYIAPINNMKGAVGVKANSILIKPDTQICECCKIEKPFNNIYFNLKKNSKFGLNYICKECKNEEKIINRYNKLGIKIKKIDDLSLYEWWNFLYEEKIDHLPKKLYIEENYIILIKYIVIDVLKLNSKSDILLWFIRENLKKYKINSMVEALGGKVKTLKLIFPDMDFTQDDFNKYTDNNTIAFLDEYVKTVSIEEILKGNLKLRNNKDTKNLFYYYGTKGYTINDLWLWYFKKKNIMYPNTNRKITIYDFTNKTYDFFKSKDNVIGNIKHYCENICEENILNSIDNTDKLKQWIFKYFKQSNITNVFSCYNIYYNGLYDLLIECYPEIKEKNVLFEWEWTQCNRNDRDFLIQMLREYVLYRMKDVVVDIIRDAPKYINFSYFKIVFPKMIKHIDKHRFDNFYEWICLSFPEFKDEWTKEDFSIITAKDGTELDSFSERDVYEYIQNNSSFKYIKSIGKKRNGKYVFELNDKYEYNKFCPDFVIEYINKDNKKIKLSKPIIIEYYGMYDKNTKFKIFKDYIKKTDVKENFYKNKKEIYYIGIYPNDLKNNFEGLAEKLGSFYMENLLNIEEIITEAI